MPQMEWKFEIGHLLTIICIIVTVSVGYGSLTKRMDNLEVWQTREGSKHEQLIDEIRALQRQIVKLETKIEMQEEASRWRSH